MAGAHPFNGGFKRFKVEFRAHRAINYDKKQKRAIFYLNPAQA
jgi:hypothetical protein